MPTRPERLHVVTRADLPPAQQAVQAIHAAREFQRQYPALECAWFEASNHIALLAVEDEAALSELEGRARWHGCGVAGFREPDLGGALTAVAIEPGGRGHALCKRIPLALQPPR